MPGARRGAQEEEGGAVSEKRYRFKCHNCGRVWRQDWDFARRLGTLPPWKGPAGTTFGRWSPARPCGCRWGAETVVCEEHRTDRLAEPEEEVFV